MRLASAVGTLGMCLRGAAAGVGRRGGAAGGVRPGRGYWASRDPFVVPACRDTMRLASAAGISDVCVGGAGQLPAGGWSRGSCSGLATASGPPATHRFVCALDLPRVFGGSMFACVC